MTRPGDDDRVAPIVELRTGAKNDPTDELLRSAIRELDADPATEDDHLLSALSEALPGPPMILRVVLVVVAGAQLIAVLPWLVNRDPFSLLGDTAGSHLTRDGALGLAVAVAALMTAWRARWAVPSFLLASAALIAQAAAGLIDNEASPGVGELIHLPSVALACLIAMSSIRLADLKPTRPS